jgi:hypothetical protein
MEMTLILQGEWTTSGQIGKGRDFESQGGRQGGLQKANMYNENLWRLSVFAEEK